MCVLDSLPALIDHSAVGYRWPSLAVLLLVTACGHGDGDPDGEVVAVVCGPLVASPIVPVCAPAPTECDLLPDAVINGSRLRATWYEASSGTRLFAGIRDSMLDVRCDYLSTASGARCLPESSTVPYYADISCASPLLATPARQYLVGTDSVTALDPGPVHTGSIFMLVRDPMNGTEHCVAVPDPPTVYDAIESVIAIDTFVEGTADEASGSPRLARAAWRGSDGSLFPVVVNELISDATQDAADAIDLLRGEACSYSLDRCLPVGSIRLACPPAGPCHYEHPACQACDGTMHGMGTHARYGWAGCPDSFDRVTVVAATTSCGEAAGTCDCPAGGQIVDYQAADTFPRLEPTLATGPRLRVPAITDGAGYCQRVKLSPGPAFEGDGFDWGHPYDAMLDFYCEPRATSAGLRCAPELYVLASVRRGVFRDPGCTQPIDVAVCDTPFGPCTAAFDVTADEYYSLGTVGAGDFYTNASGPCEPVFNFQYPWWELGPRAESTYEALTEVFD